MKKFQLSTGTKFGLLLFYTSTVTIPFVMPLEIVSLFLLFFLFIAINKWKTGAKIILGFMCLTGISYLTYDKLGVAQVFNTWAIIIRKLLVPFGIGYYFIMSTKISSLMASMEKMKLPKAITIPLLVMFRYMPALKDEYTNIKNAMKIRGIEPGIKSLKNPSLALEYLFVPLLFSSSNIGEELSQAAFSKGISIDGDKHRYFETHFGIFDAIIFSYILIFIFCLVRR